MIRRRKENPGRLELRHGGGSEAGAGQGSVGLKITSTLLWILCPRKNPKIQESCKNKAIHRTSARANSKTQGGTRIDSDSICHRHHSVFFGFSNGLSIYKNKT